MAPQWVSFEISNSFKTKVRLPPQNAWRFHRDDALVTDTLYSRISHKGRFFSHHGPRLPRLVAITVDGFLVIYENDNEGHVLELKEATTVATKTDICSKGVHKRSSIKVKMCFGSVQLLVIGPTHVAWLNALNSHGRPIRQMSYFAPSVDTDSVSSLHVNGSLTPSMQFVMDSMKEEDYKGEEHSAVAPQQKQNFHSVSVVIPIASYRDQTLSDSEDVKMQKDNERKKKNVSFTENLNEDDYSEADTTIDSIRHGELSVATLRRVLEEKITGAYMMKAKKIRPVLPPASRFVEAVPLASSSPIYRPVAPPGRYSDDSDSL